MTNVEKKRLILFIAIAYGVTIIMSIFMKIGLNNGHDLSAFMNVMMTYPACGVILGLLCFGDKEMKLPKIGYLVFLVTSAIMVVVALLSAFLPETMIESGAGLVSNWNMYSQYVLLAGSAIAYILFWVCGKEKRKNAGLSRNHVLLSIAFVALFILFFVLRIYIGYGIVKLGGIDPGFAALNATVFNVKTWATCGILLLNFPLTFIAFLGEEYGWRYYLQPIMQKKFGLRGGVLLLGVIWAVWHLGADFMFYSTDSGPQMFVAQLITCVALGIFFGYVFMKTQNIWAIAIMHYINNNFIVIFSGGDVNVLQNQTVSWGALIVSLVQNLIFMAFILAPIYNKKKEVTES